VVRLQENRRASDRPEDFITGFLAPGKVHGRPVDILRFGVDGFLLTDDYAGVIYYVYEE
jgi:glucose/arabinose dehydrogenase